MKKKITVIIAEDQEVFRLGLKNLLEDSLGFKVIAETDNGKELTELVKNYKPNIVIADHVMPELSGLKALVKIKLENPNIKTLLISNIRDDKIQDLCFKGNIDGYLFKIESLVNIKFAIKQILKNKSFYSLYEEKIKLNKLNRNKEFNPFDQLSNTELEVLCKMVNCVKISDIANNMKISVRTVEKHKENIIKKIGIKNISELIKKAYIWGICYDDELVSIYY